MPPCISQNNAAFSAAWMRLRVVPGADLARMNPVMLDQTGLWRGGTAEG
jgi:hypothetical protein